jgi:hypothetical protein
MLSHNIQLLAAQRMRRSFYVNVEGEFQPELLEGIVSVFHK